MSIRVIFAKTVSLALSVSFFCVVGSIVEAQDGGGITVSIGFAGIDIGLLSSDGGVLALTTNPDGSLEGEKWQFDKGQLVSDRISGSIRIVNGEQQLNLKGITDLENETFSKSFNYQSNSVWNSGVLPKSTPIFDKSFLIGVTNRQDPIATELLSDWNGNPGGLINARILADFYKAFPELEKQAQTIAIITDRSLVPAAISLVSLVDENQIPLSARDLLFYYPVRTFDSPTFRDSAITVLPVRAFVNAFGNSSISGGTSGSSSQNFIEAFNRTNAVKSKLFGFDLFFAEQISVFDVFADPASKLEDVATAFESSLSDIAPKRHCLFAPNQDHPNVRGAIACEYYSRDVGVNSDFWMRTTFDFFVSTPDQDKKRTVVFQPSSQYDASDESAIPVNFRELDSSTDEQRLAENVAKSMFQTLTQRKLP